MSSMVSESEIEITVLPPPLFNFDANQWFQKLKDNIVASDRADSSDEEKIRVLLSHLGNEGKAIYESLEAKDNPGERITSFEELTEALASYFDSARNVLFERLKFFKMKRRSEQSVVAFAKDLTIAASFCEFAEVDNIIRDKLLEQLEDAALIERLLVEGGSLTLARAVNICQKWEERKSHANGNKPPDCKDDPEPPNSSATNDSRRKLESELETATDYGGGLPAVPNSGVVPQERQTTAPVNREESSDDSRDVWGAADPITHTDEEESEPNALMGHNPDEEIKMETADTEKEITFLSPLVIPTAVSEIETDPLLSDKKFKGHNPDEEIKMETADTEKEMTFLSPLVIPTAVSEIETDPLSSDKQSKGHDPDEEINMETADMGKEMTFYIPLVNPTAVSEIETDPLSSDEQSKGEKPYACSSCDYRTSRRGTLKRHLRTHKGEKPYACDRCDYRASTRYVLHQHLLTHTDPGATITEELDAFDTCPVATSPQPHLPLPAMDEPTCSTSDHDPDEEIMMERADKEMSFYSPLVIPTAVSEIETDPLSSDKQSKDGKKLESVDKVEEITSDIPLAVPTAVSEVQTDSTNQQSKDPGVTVKEELDASDYSAATSSQPHLWLPAKDERISPISDPGVTIMEEQDASDSSPTATSPQHHFWLPVKDEPTSPTSGEKPYACDTCDYRASQLGDLKKHSRVHTGEKPFACDICDYRASRVGNLSQHKKTHTGEKRYACDACDYRASRLCDIKRHLRTHTGEKPFACGSCDYRASELGHLKTHLKTHSGEKPYACGICDYRAKRFDHLKAHLRTHTGEKPYACDSCDYRANHPGDLKRHVRTHTGEKPYVCDICDYRSSQFGSLKIHLRTHTGEKPYACDNCDFLARHLSSMRQHMRIHAGEKPYACDSCDYRASQLGTLKIHLKRHTGEKPYA